MPGLQTRVTTSHQGLYSKYFAYFIWFSVLFLYPYLLLTFICAELCRGANTLRLVETRREREHLFSKCLYICFMPFTLLHSVEIYSVWEYFVLVCCVRSMLSILNIKVAVGLGQVLFMISVNFIFENFPALSAMVVNLVIWTGIWKMANLESLCTIQERKTC